MTTRAEQISEQIIRHYMLWTMGNAGEATFGQIKEKYRGLIAAALSAERRDALEEAWAIATNMADVMDEREKTDGKDHGASLLYSIARRIRALADQEATK